jgi:hydrogenase maturation protease
MRTIIIGVGNPYRRDDGVGPAVAKLLRGRGVEVAQSLGETTELIELWQDYDLAILVDAVRARPAHPGRVHHLVVADTHSAGIRAASSHGLDLGEAIELARVLDRLPKRLALYAVEVEDVGHGPGLSPPVAAAAKHLADEIYAEVARCA